MDRDAVSGEALKNLYHEACIGCHTDMIRAGQASGPSDSECRACHNPDAAPSSRQDIRLDKAAHYRHIASPSIAAGGQDKNCAVCHHVYDAQRQTRVHESGKEDSCSACHLTRAAQKALLAAEPQASDANGPLARRPVLDRAAHQACVNCHLDVAAKDAAAKTGPSDCAGCHGSAALARLAGESAKAEPASIPRLERGQADAYLMLTAVDNAQKKVAGTMRPVSFNHKLHESVTPDCRSCHHRKIAACTACHSLEGKAEGEFHTLYSVMHQAQSSRSCLGCHNRKKQDPACAGCHIDSTVPLGRSSSSCESCHATPPGMGDAAAEDGTLLRLDDEDARELARLAAESRAGREAEMYAMEDIPEKVTIGVLSGEYEPVELPHRKIVMTLFERQKGNRLAAAFHPVPSTLCRGCHHNSPPSKTPPACASCHGADIHSAAEGRLHLKAAYHQQCMACHARMAQKPAATECVDCHKPRQNS